MIERTVAPVIAADVVKEVISKPKKRASTETAEANAQGLEFEDPATAIIALP